MKHCRIIFFSRTNMTVHKAAYPLKKKDTVLLPNFFLWTNDLPISVCRERLPYTLKSPTKKRETFLHNVCIVEQRTSTLCWRQKMYVRILRRSCSKLHFLQDWTESSIKANLWQKTSITRFSVHLLYWPKSSAMLLFFSLDVNTIALQLLFIYNLWFISK